MIDLPLLNERYSYERDGNTNCLNPKSLYTFSTYVSEAVKRVVTKGHFPLVLGGDCSLLIGITSALKALGVYGLVFCDAHADLYEPEKSVTGEVADMELAIITGRGPELLSNISGLRPYMEDKNIIHVGQRDREETLKFGSQDIQRTGIKCYDLQQIEEAGLNSIVESVLNSMKTMQVQGFWLHFDTDVVCDEENPAVDYRIPGGIPSANVEMMLKAFLSTGRIAGLSVTIFNPALDRSGNISKMLTRLIANAFETGNT